MCSRWVWSVCGKSAGIWPLYIEAPTINSCDTLNTKLENLKGTQRCAVMHFVLSEGGYCDTRLDNINYMG